MTPIANLTANGSTTPKPMHALVDATASGRTPDGVTISFEGTFDGATAKLEWAASASGPFRTAADATLTAPGDVITSLSTALFFRVTLEAAGASTDINVLAG